MSPFRAVPPRVARDRRDDRWVAGRWTPYARPAAGWVKSVQDDTCSVVILDELITGVIYLDDRPTPGDIVEVETRGDLAVILNYYDHPLPPPEELPYPFIDGYDTGPPVEPAWDATVVPYLSDHSDATYLQFREAQGYHDFLVMVGDTSAIPPGPVRALTFVLRGRTNAGTTPQGITPSIYVDELHGFFQYYGPDFNTGIVLPVGTAWVETSVTLDQGALDLAMGPDEASWTANNHYDDWTTVEGLVESMRTHGFELTLQYTGATGLSWQISEIDLLFHTEGGP